MSHAGRRSGLVAWGAAFCAAAAMAGCGGEPQVAEKSEVTFSLGAGVQALAQRSNALATSPLASVAAVVVSLEDSSGALVKDGLRLGVYAFSGSYVSDTVQLELGAYRVTRFLVVDAANQTLFAAPNAADPNVDPKLVAQVKQPLPLTFQVGHGATHTQPVEVLPVEWRPPQDFGYATFTLAVKIYAKSSRQVFYGPGPDGVWFTGDDEVQTYTDLVKKANGQTLTSKWFYVGNGYDGRGPDGLWFTEDDVPAGWWWERTDAFGSGQNGPGPDGIWLNDDDAISWWQKYDLSSQANGTSNGIGIEPLYDGPGADGVWFTDDDQMYAYYKCEWNAAGQQLMRTYYGSPGPDGVWFTADDEIGADYKGAYVRWRYPAANDRWDSWYQEITYSGPGADGLWFTSDDTVNTCRTHVFGDGTQYWTEERTYLPGPDNVCFTADDQLIQYGLGQNTY